MVELMPHQAKAVNELRNGNILKGGVGTGKTMTALAYYKDSENPERLIVITTAKKRDSKDWQAEAREFGIFPEVDSWNNLMAYEDVENAFFIFDEQRVVGSGVWVKSFIKIAKKNQWILLSATPGDSWMDYIPLFVANGFYSSRAEFLREHVIFNRFAKYPKVERFIFTGKLAEHLRSILVEMPFERHTTRHEIDVFVDYDQTKMETVWRKRWNYREERPIRHVAELFALMRFTTNSDPSRILKIRDLMLLHPKLIIFYNFDYELDILRTLDVARGELNGHNHDPIPDADEWVYLVQYMAGAEAWNCVETDAMVFYSLTYSYRQFEQSKGRIDRLNTPFTDLYYYVLRGASVIDSAIFRSLQDKKNFNERALMKSWGGGDLKLV